MAGKIRNKPDINILGYEKYSERTVYSIGGIGLLFGHVLYLAVFVVLGVVPMIAFNVFSVLFYSGLLFALYHTSHRGRLVLAALAEVVLHACLGVVTLGWHMGFSLFLLFLMPIPFYLPVKKLPITYASSLVPLLLYVLMREIFDKTDHVMYSFRDPSINNMLYVMNVVLGSSILIYISSIHMFNREVMLFKLSSKNESLQKLATIDPLTQLFNHRAMMEYLKLVRHNSERSGKGYVVGLGDIDDLRKANDIYGFTACDDALKQIAGIIAKEVPAEGYAARWGGDEFLFVIPNADIKKGSEVAEKLRNDIWKRNFRSGEMRFGVSMTFGIVEGEPGEDIEKVISGAGERLKFGKENGKNKVVQDN